MTLTEIGLLISIISVVIGIYKVLQIKNMKKHRKAMWFAVFLLLPVLGLLLFIFSKNPNDKMVQRSHLQN
jgi:uncharacterized membrane protein YozB (DUF420 family)